MPAAVRAMPRGGVKRTSSREDALRANKAMRATIAGTLLLPHPLPLLLLLPRLLPLLCPPLCQLLRPTPLGRGVPVLLTPLPSASAQLLVTRTRASLRARSVASSAVPHATPSR